MMVRLLFVELAMDYMFSITMEVISKSIKHSNLPKGIIKYLWQDMVMLLSQEGNKLSNYSKEVKIINLY